MQVCLTAIRTSGSLHAHQGSGRHLSASHTVDGVVDENHGDVLTTVQCMDGLTRTDAGHVAVALIGEDELVGPKTLDGRSTGWSTSVTCFNPIDIHIAVCEHRTTHGTDGDGVFLHAHLLDDFSHQLVHHTMATTRTIVHRRLIHQRRLAIYFILRNYELFFCQHIIYNLTIYKVQFIINYHLTISVRTAWLNH